MPVYADRKENKIFNNLMPLVANRQNICLGIEIIILFVFALKVLKFAEELDRKKTYKKIVLRPIIWFVEKYRCVEYTKNYA